MPPKRKVRVLKAPARTTVHGATIFREKAGEPAPEHDTVSGTIPDDLLVEILKMSPQEIYDKIVTVEIEFNDEYGSRATFEVPIITTVTASMALGWTVDLEHYYIAKYPEYRLWTAYLAKYMKKRILRALMCSAGSAGRAGVITSALALDFQKAAFDFLQEQSEFPQQIPCAVDLRLIHSTVHCTGVVATPARLSSSEVARLFGA